jgi:septal ring-binding cell division protein DamX
VKVTLVFFISLLSFSVGTFVGKQVSDSEHRKIALEGEYKGEGREVASESTEAEHGEAEGKISEKEVASLTEEFVNKESEPAGPEDHEGYKTYARKGEGREIASEKPAEHAAPEHADKVAKAEPEEHAAPEKHEAPKHEAPKHEAAKHEDKHDAEKAAPKPAEAVHKLAEKLNDSTHKIAEKVAEGQAPSDGEVEKPKVKPGLPPIESAAVGKYTVQVASFAEEKDAKTRATELKGKGYQAFYLSATVNGKVWHRVLVGMFPTVKSADEYRGKLIKEGGTKTAIVQKIVQ